MRKALRKCLRRGVLGRGRWSLDRVWRLAGDFYMFSRLGTSSLFFHHQTDSSLLLSKPEGPNQSLPTNENIYQLTHKHTEYLHR